MPPLGEGKPTMACCGEWTGELNGLLDRKLEAGEGGVGVCGV